MFGAAPVEPTEFFEGKAEELKEVAAGVIEEEEEALLTRIRDYVEDKTRNVAIGAGAFLAVILALAVVLRRRRTRAERCPTCGREIPVGGTCPFCEGWTGDFDVQPSAQYAEPSPVVEPPVERRPAVPPTIQEVEPTVHVEPPPAQPPAEQPPLDRTRVIDRPPRHMALLVVKQGPQPDARFEVSQKVTTLGRHKGNDIHIDHPTVSREHARVRLEDDTFVIYDLGSANGTKVDGVLGEEPQPLKDGDEVQLGNTVLVFKIVS